MKLDKYFETQNDDLNKNFLDDFKNYLEKGIAEGIEKISLHHSSESYILLPWKKMSNGKKSVLLVTHELNRTGAPIVMLDMAKILLEKNYFITVVSPRDGALATDFREIGIPVVVMPEMLLYQLRHSEIMLFAKQIDLDAFVKNFNVTFMNTATLYNFVRRYYNTEYKIRWWIHEGEVLNELRKDLPNMITDNVKVFCVGEYAKDKIDENNLLYYPDILNYGVVDEKRNKRKSNDIHDKVRFISVGMIQARKGQKLLLEAIKKLPKKYQEKSEFIFVGEAHDDDEEGWRIEKEIKRYSHDHENVVLKSFMPRNELYDLYDNIDVIIVSSTDDPMPVVATENFMLKKACICSDQTGTARYIKDKVNGFVFQSDNVDELIEKIIYAIEHKDKLQEIGRNARKIYEKYFEMGVFEKKLLKVMEAC